MKQLNNKGFTLIELLATIVIIGLVIGLSTFGIIKVVNNSKDQSAVISENNIKEAAKIYSTEKNNDDSYWLDIADQEYKYFCVTIQELINKGLLDKKATLDSKFQSTDYVAIKKNKVTMVSSNSEILSKDVDQNDEDIKTMIGVCGGSIINEKVNKIPKLNDETSWTDQIDIPFDDAEAESSITDRKCWYGTTTGNLSKEGEVEGKTCKIASNDGKLKDSTYYYVRICMTTERNSKICSDTESYVTKNLISPIIDVNNNVTITYKDDNIKGEAGHYFKSTLDGTSTSNVQKCDNNFNCEESSTTSITKDTWYKTNDSSVTLTYQNSGDGRVTARITDRSGNSKETQKYISVYKVTFNKGTADKIDGTTSDVSKICVAETGKTCTIKSPTIEKANYTVIGWNTNSNAKTSSWNVGVEKNISNNSTYYPIVRINKVYIHFNPNGGTITPETTTAKGNIYKWKTDSDGTILRTNANGSTYSTDFFSIKYGNSTGNNGLPDYNNSKYLEIKKIGYSAVSGSEWKCLSGCTTSDKMFNKKSIYNASDFCNASNGDCTVVLGVNWQANTYTVTYDANGGSGAPSAQTKTYGTDLTLSSTTPTKAGYTFQGWGTTSNATTVAYKPGAKYTSNANLTLYAIWKTNTYTITYNANGGTGAPSSQTKTHGTDLTLSSTTPTKAGYTFQGWGTTSNATTVAYKPGAKYTSNASITLYAIWAKNASKPVVTKIDNKSGGNWVNHSFDIYVYATDEVGISRIEWSYDQSNWYYANMTTPVKQSDGSYESHGSWSAARNQPVYFRALNTNGLYSDIKSTSVKIDKTPPAAQIKVTAAGVNILTCTSETCTAPYGFNNVALKISATDDASGINTNYTFWYNSRNTTSYTTPTNSEARTLTDGSDTRIIDSKGYREFKFVFTDVAGNTKEITIQIQITDFGIRFNCANNLLTVYNIISCNNYDCNYNTFNGISKSNTVVRNTLSTEIKCSSSQTLYVNSSSGLNCRTGASTSNSLLRTFSNCTKMTAYQTTTSGWYYNSSLGCYLSGSYLSSSYPCSSSGGSTSSCRKIVSCLGAATGYDACKAVVAAAGGTYERNNPYGDCYGYFCNSCPRGWIED